MNSIVVVGASLGSLEALSRLAEGLAGSFPGQIFMVLAHRWTPQHPV